MPRRPAIPPLRALELRELQSILSNVRERLDQLDAAVATAASAVSTTTSSTASSASTAARADTATALATARAFDLSGVTTDGPHTFDGTGNVTIEILEVPLALLEQDSATVGQALVWDGSGGWTPATLVDTDGTVDHGALLGLADDDHPQYLNEARGNALYSPLGHTHATTDVTGLVELIEDTVGASLVAGAGISITYDDGTGDTTVEATGGGGMANPMTDTGDIIFGQSAGSPAALPIGAEDEVLTVVAGLPQWAPAAAGGGDFSSPMEDYGDLIVGQSGGSASRLPAGAEGQYLVIDAGLPTWATVAPGSGMSNPMEDYGDLIVGQSAGSPAALPIGADGEVLTVVAGVPAWDTAAGGGSGWSYQTVASDVVNNTITDEDITDLTWLPSAAGTYEFEWLILFETSNVNSLPQFTFLWFTDSSLYGGAMVRVEGGNTTQNGLNIGTGYTTPRSPTGTARGANIPLSVQGKGMVIAGSTPTGTGIKVRWRAEIATNNATIKAGSFIRFRSIA